MTAPTTETVVVQPSRIASGRLPKGSPWWILLGAMVISFAIFGVMNVGSPLADLNVAGALFVGMLLYIAFVYVLSLIAESRRHATDRLMTALIATAFVLACLPLASWKIICVLVPS